MRIEPCDLPHCQQLTAEQYDGIVARWRRTNGKAHGMGIPFILAPLDEAEYTVYWWVWGTKHPDHHNEDEEDEEVV